MDKKIIIGACVIIFILAAAGVYGIRTHYATNTGVSTIATTTSAATIASSTTDETNSDTSDQSNTDNLPACASAPTSTVATLTPIKVQWTSLTPLPNLSLLRPDSCNQGQYEYSASGDIGTADYYKVGTVSGGQYDGGDVILAVFNDGEGGSEDGDGMLVDHLISKNGVITVIATSSDMIAALDPSKVSIDSNSVFPDLQYPQNFSYNGVQFTFEDYSPNGADSHFPIKKVLDGTLKQTLKVAFTDPQFGPVYTDVQGSDSGYGQSGYYVGFSDTSQGFYIQAPDGTFRVYGMVFPSWWNSNTQTPALTWNDGTQNTASYTPTDFGGCGSVNYASVMTSLTSADLTPIGKTSTGDTVYGLVNPDNEILQLIYKDWYSQQKPSYTDFVSARPVFFWYDPLGRLIKFQGNYWTGAECGKPVIYLYPTATTTVSVQIAPKGGMLKSDPAYNGGWDVTATPQSLLTDLMTGKQYPYLFWEGRGGLYQTPSKGFVVTQADVHGFLVQKLAELGLNSKEAADFIDFWEPRMTGSPYYFVTFLGTAQMNQIAPLTITPKPDTVIRILMDFHPLAAPVPVQGYDITTPNRNGFTVVEWGGVIQ